MEFDVVIIDEATQALEAVRLLRHNLEDDPYTRCRSAGYPCSRLKSSSWRATQSNSLRRSIHYPEPFRRALSLEFQYRVRALTRIRQELKILFHDTKVLTVKGIATAN